ncbi:hypothetical protein [Dyadobacter chenhuakuii]|uniref:Uncharacterized protein n=1 Tax=Dyadobacter chenhuakuii TaxID=2909339 RepID=A0ABY4XIV0_9BACT|nr:hypothetical protein [Dyadobacter chenhuakuii]MCF2496125.1 hypothetical protein [Dyadobacter chenhuakuii]USJ30189.1 hypothetical protein NFI80_20280 [Dyadobacter chenhuakuii]
MLNYKELSEKFTNELVKFDTDSLSAWVEYDYQREVLRKLSMGAHVWVKSETVVRSKPELKTKSSEFEVSMIYSFAA